MQGEEKKDSIKIGAGFAAAESVKKSVIKVNKDFEKPLQFDRNLLDSGTAKYNIKKDAFKSGTVKDPYTGNELTLTQAEAKIKYGDKWQEHVAEADHIIPLKKIYEKTINNVWLKNDDIRASANNSKNLEVTSRKFNNAKRSHSNQELVENNEYLDKNNLKLTKQGKEKAKQSEELAQNFVRKQNIRDTTRNIIQTGHNAGMAAATNAGITCLTMSGIMNLTSVIKGEKSPEDAIADTIVDTTKSAGVGYVMGNSLTIIQHSISNSSSKFIKALSESNVPGKIITAISLTGDTLIKYFSGKITTQECLISLGEKGINCVTTGYSTLIGQTLIPIPVVGAAVGALIGSIITSHYYNQLTTMLQKKQLEHQERLRIIAECEEAAKQTRAFREELEKYLNSYFKEYKNCFDDALSTIHESFQQGNADGVIAGANQITRKLGGNVYYNDMNQFKKFILSGC